MVWIAMVALAVVIAGVLVYNQLIRAKVRVRQAWAQVDAQLQRRHDLVPNLLATLQKYASHERAAFDAVTEARARALSIRDPLERQVVEDEFGAALASLLARSENYPGLQSDSTFRHLQHELAATEDRLAFARGFANDRVTRYRELVDGLPGRLIARPLGFPRGSLFTLGQEQANDRPDIRLGG